MVTERTRKLFAATAAGNAAYKAGKTETPALDIKTLGPLIGQCPVGDGWATEVLNAWREGWREAKKNERFFLVTVEKTETVIVHVGGWSREEAEEKAVKLAESGDQGMSKANSIAAVYISDSDGKQGQVLGKLEAEHKPGTCGHHQCSNCNNLIHDYESCCPFCDIVQPQIERAETKGRVFVTVETGLAYIRASEGIEVVKLDYEDPPDPTGAESDEKRWENVPAEFRELPEIEAKRY